MERITGKELANQMGDFVNSFNHDKYKTFIDGFCQQHRTLQQSSFRMILELIEFMASDNYRVDGRNEQSKEVAKKLLAGFKSEWRNELKSQGESEEYINKYIGDYSTPSKFLGSI